MPETLFWYVMLLATGWTLWRSRGKWRALVPWLVFAGGTLALFALVEGNLGTLYRHRVVTVVPIIALIAGPTLLALLDHARSSRAGWALGGRGRPLPGRPTSTS